ncbi:related to histidine kinase tcsA protein [Phialocephala subalpina]|uniref:histidine kinase n=1 Tax=Phialocephala subalpina TaxID=576137 RepID=A0A1L7WEH7_9HELO|nr:related to histidine kinase tcsA protein [Phialocephala subalpina]
MTASISMDCGMHEILQQHPDAFESRPCGPRTYKPLRQRARVRFAGEIKSPSPSRAVGVEEMDTTSAGETPEHDDLLDRNTLCLPDFAGNAILHGGDNGFKDVLRQYFPSLESNASERLVNLKSKLREASTHDFWGILMEEMCDITGSQCGFVAKRMLVDDQDSAVEMPELGEPGSCLMGVAFYINNGIDVKEMYRDYRYHAYGTPCAHMRHDKIFIVPEKLTNFTPNNPNPMPWKQSEAFIGLPLFHEGKCFAHFGMIWSSEGATKRKLGWPFIEMFLHSLEDMILQRILEGRGFAKDSASPHSTPAKVIPLSAITASQSLKPYARSLSHELRTPMQGVVGMLDIMYSTVLDAIANQPSDHVRTVFKDLKNHIEVVQDSSRRAVEAADNVVHAYDMNMQMPETPLTPNDVDIIKGMVTPSLESERQSPPMSRKRERSNELDFCPGPPMKRMFTMAEAENLRTYYPDGIITDGPAISITETAPSTKPPSEVSVTESEPRCSPLLSPAFSSSTLRRIITRDFLRSLVNEALRNGHPTSEVHNETDLGEKIDVKTIGSRGEVQDRTIYLEIESDVPEVIITEEQHLQFALQKLVDNAIKFTEHGSIRITVKISRGPQVVEIWVVDTGCGISEESKSNLFKPHFQQDSSISRSRDGLGLSLFNAKAQVRKNLGGDVTLERSDTEGPSKGSEFLIRLPISTLEVGPTDTALVGASPPPTYCHPLCRSWSEPAISSDKTLDASTSTLPTRSNPPKQAARKRQSFNPKLAVEYPLNILIAEDNAINRNVAVGSLNKLGYSNANITVTFDGLEAVKVFEASLSKPPAERFTAVLMDIWMPNMDGYEATRKIVDLSRVNGHSTKVIAVTADVTGESAERAKAAGMESFLAKPYKVADIERLIVENFDRYC